MYTKTVISISGWRWIIVRRQLESGFKAGNVGDVRGTILQFMLGTFIRNKKLEQKVLCIKMHSLLRDR